MSIKYRTRVLIALLNISVSTISFSASANSVFAVERFYAFCEIEPMEPECIERFYAVIATAVDSSQYALYKSNVPLSELFFCFKNFKTYDINKLFGEFMWYAKELPDSDRNLPLGFHVSLFLEQQFPKCN
jgi:hypothetical protein